MAEIINKSVPKIYAIYVRVSQQKKDKEKYSIPAQIRILQDYVKQQNGVVYKIYNENENRLDASGETIADRLVFQQLLGDAKQKKFHACLVIDPDRLSRSEDLFDWLTIRKIFTENSIEVVTPTQRFDLSDEDDSFMFFLFGSLSSREKRKTLKRLRRGAEESVRKGIYQGTRYVVYGYRYDKLQKKLIPILEEIKLIILIFKKVAAGMSTWALLTYLNEKGYKNRMGKTFTSHHLLCILHRRFYCDGYYIWNGIRSEKPIVEPRVEIDTWEEANETLAFHKSKMAQTKNTRSDSDFILQGSLKCRHCTKNMVGGTRISNHKTGEKKKAYRCCTYLSRGKSACTGQSVDAKMVETQAYEILKKIVGNKELLELEKEEIRNLLAETNPDLEKNIKISEQQLKENKQKQKKCLDAHYDDALSLKQFKTENTRLLDEEKTIQHELARIKQLLKESQTYQGNIEKIFALLGNFDEIWQNLSPNDKKMLFRNVFKSIYIEDKSRKHYKNIENYELYEPFASILETGKSQIGGETQWENAILQLRPLDVR